MEKEYTEMTVDELKSKMEDMEKTFNEYHSILEEVYGNMYDLSTEYNKISEILANRHGR